MWFWTFMILSAASIEDHEAAVMKHARGLQAELAGQAETTLQLLREGHALAPLDDAIAFDLARVAMLHPTLARTSDTEDFIELEPVNADARVLRAYLLALHREVHAAQSEVNEALSLEPAHPEALAARSMLSTLHPGVDAGILGTRLRLSSEYDSNVALLPQNIPSSAGGVRGTVDGGLRYTPLRGPYRLDLNATVHIATHLNHRTVLKTYDVMSGTAWAGFTWDPGVVRMTLDTVGTLVYAGEQKDPFLRQGYALLELQVPVGDLDVGDFKVGAYGLAGYRSYGAYNASGDNDRTGPYNEVGVTGEWRGGAYSAAVRGGYLAESAHGLLQRVHGATTSVVGRWSNVDWTVAAAFTYTYRNYLDNPFIRHDHFIEPAVQATYALTDTFHVVGSYAFIAVRSLAPYTYDRHLTELGVEASW